jgi:hypothetical protein
LIVICGSSEINGKGKCNLIKANYFIDNEFGIFLLFLL